MHNAIIIPTYNEKENIAALIDEILSVQPDATIYIIDDKSPDGTGKIVSKISQKKPQVKLITKQNRQGLGTAIMLGLQTAYNEGAQKIIKMDADFSHNPKYIPQLLGAVDNADLAIGSRYIKGGQVDYPFYRKLLSFMANTYARTYLRLKVHDATSGFRCYKRQTIEKLDFSRFSSKGYVFEVEGVFAAKKRGLKIVEIPIHFADRRAGKAKMRAKEVIQGMLVILNMRRPQKAKA